MLIGSSWSDHTPGGKEAKPQNDRPTRQTFKQRRRANRGRRDRGRLPRGGLPALWFSTPDSVGQPFRAYRPADASM